MAFQGTGFWLHIWRFLAGIELGLARLGGRIPRAIPSIGEASPLGRSAGRRLATTALADATGWTLFAGIPRGTGRGA